MVECPKCLGSKEIFNGEDFEICKFCAGEGEVAQVDDDLLEDENGIDCEH